MSTDQQKNLTKTMADTSSGARLNSVQKTDTGAVISTGLAEKKQSIPISSSAVALQNESKSKHSKTRKKETRVRTRLPVIESYEKEFEYTADAPGRVVVRLERLMGTDRIRVTDQKYMNNLFKQLQADEQKLWLKRSKQRKQSERNRFRQLAIEGYMEPGPDMQDLYNHPVFRVNRILDRLSRLDHEINILPMAPLPPITPVEPFDEYSRTGILFPFHPGHYRRTPVTTKADNEFIIEKLVHSKPSITQSLTSTVDAGTDEDFFRKYERKSGMISSREITRDDEWGGEDYNNDDGIEFEELGGLEIEGSCNADLVGVGHLSQIQRFFGITAEERLEKTFTPHRAALVDYVYDEGIDGANEIYTAGKDVLDTYKREQLKADNVVNKLNRAR